MASKYYKNCIVIGVVDSYCLLCQSYVSKKGIKGHIRTEAHKNFLKDTEYVENYEENHIRKVKIGYYCEECNLLIKSIIKVDLHIKEPSHATNINKYFFKEVVQGVIVFDDILIDKQAWNGLYNGTCYICNTDYSDENDHKDKSVHILNLVLSKWELQRNQFVYRKVDDCYFNCLTCNSLVSLKNKGSHTKEAEHMNYYSKCQEAKKKLIYSQSEQLKKKNTIDHVGVQDESKSSIDERNKSVADKKEKSENKERLIKETTANNNDDNNKIFTPAEAFTRAINFAKNNNLRYKRNSAYCKICEIKISATLKKMKEHVDNRSHQEKMRIPLVEKRRTCGFVYSKITIRELLYDNILVNNKFCMSALSYNFIIRIGSKFRCLLCQISTHSFETHRRSVKHEEAMLATSVIMNFDSEFIREVTPDVYHCSVCNYLESGWHSLKNHLASTWHNDKKKLYRQFMHEYNPSINEHRRKYDFFEYIRDLYCRSRK